MADFKKYWIWYIVFLVIGAYSWHESSISYKISDFDLYYKVGNNTYVPDYKPSKDIVGGILPYPMHVQAIFELAHIIPYKLALFLWLFLRTLGLVWALHWFYNRYIQKNVLLYVFLAMSLYATTIVNGIGNIAAFTFIIYVMAWELYEQQEYFWFSIFIILCSAKYTPLVLLVILGGNGIFTLAIYAMVLMVETIFWPGMWHILLSGAWPYFQYTLTPFILGVPMLYLAYRKPNAINAMLVPICFTTVFNQYGYIWALLPTVWMLMKCWKAVIPGMVIAVLILTHRHFKITDPEYLLFCCVMANYLIYNYIVIWEGKLRELERRTQNIINVENALRRRTP